MIAALVAALAAPQAADAVFAKEGAIGLVPPPAMRAAEGFAGFEDPATGASITFAELPAEAYPAIAARFDAGGALANGVTLAGAPEPLTLAGTPARLYRGSQAAGGGRYAKWLLVVNGAKVTALVTAQAPADVGERLRPAIEAALKSVRLRAPVDLESEIAALPFSIGDRAGFRAVRTLMGSGVVLTEGPRDVDPDTTQPVAIVVASLGPVPVLDRVATARRAFEGFGGMKGIVRAEEGAVGDDGYRIAGTAATAAGKPIALVQHMRFAAAGGYLRIVCVAPAAIDVAARCDRLAASVAPRARP